MGEYGDLGAGLVAAQRDAIGAEHPLHLRHDGVEDLGGRATRRSAACSSARRSISVRASALAMAVSSSAANFTIRSSVSGGGNRSLFQLAVINPHSRPSTVI